MTSGEQLRDPSRGLPALHTEPVHGGWVSLSLSHTHTHTPPLGAGDGGLCFVSQCRREVLPCSTCHPPASWKMERSFIQQYMEITYLKNLQYKSLDASEICQDEKKKKVRKEMGQGGTCHFSLVLQ